MKVEKALATANVCSINNIYVVVQFYPWFKFSFVLFWGLIM